MSGSSRRVSCEHNRDPALRDPTRDILLREPSAKPALQRNQLLFGVAATSVEQHELSHLGLLAAANAAQIYAARHHVVIAVPSVPLDHVATGRDEAVDDRLHLPPLHVIDHERDWCRLGKVESDPRA